MTGTSEGAPLQRRGRQAGFTLLEVLVALVVLGFLMAGLTQGARFGLSAWDSQQRVLAAQADADAVTRVLRGLIEQADPGQATVAAGLSGTRSTVTLITRLPHPGPAGDDEATVALGVDAAHRLVLRATPFLHATPLAPAPTPRETLLLTGVDHLEIAYWGSTTPAGERGWAPQWSGAELPDLVRIQLIFTGSQHWPPLVASPLRGKAG